MGYQYAKREAGDSSDDLAHVADVYVVRNLDVSQHASASSELLSAAARAPASTRELLQRILEDGFLALIRK
jgi:hypothetical protein